LSQQKHIFHTTLIYKRRFEMLQLLPAKSHKPYEGSQCTPKTSNICHPFTCPKPVHISSLNTIHHI